MKLIKINTDHYVVKNNDGVITHSTKVAIEDYWNVIELSLSEVKELIGEVDVEQYAWDNPVLSRKDVYELFNNVFKDRIIEGAYRISASKQVYQFDTKLRELAKQKALEDNKDKKYTRNEVHGLMCKAFIQGWKKADVVEAGLEGLETDVECAWILTRHDSTPKTEWEVEIIDGKLKLK